jgi:hypothetical protein
MKLLGIISVGFDVTDQLLIRLSAFVRYCRKKWEYNETVHHLFIDLKKAYDSVRREVLYNILIEFGVPMKLARLIKMCLNKTTNYYSIKQYSNPSGPMVYNSGALLPPPTLKFWNDSNLRSCA